MKKQILILVLLLMGALISGCVQEEEPIKEVISSDDFYSCNTENDCIIAEIPCCSGSLITESINKDYEQEWKEAKSLEYTCSGPCPGGSSAFYYEYTAQCVNNKCDFLKEFNCKEGYEYTIEEERKMCIKK